MYLDLLNAVDNEHVLQVFHGSIHPVVKGGCPLGELQVKLVNGLPQLLHALNSQEPYLSAQSCRVLNRSYDVDFHELHLQCIPPLLGEGAQVVPLVADALAAGID